MIFFHTVVPRMYKNWVSKAQNIDRDNLIIFWAGCRPVVLKFHEIYFYEILQVNIHAINCDVNHYIFL